MAINKTTRDKIVSQALTEITFARQYKQGIVWRWHKNEDLFYGKKEQTDPERKADGDKDPQINVNIASAKTLSFVETVLSKIDSPLTFKYIKPTMADHKRAKLLNALKDKDADDGDWNYKDLMAKVEAIIYGRAVFSYHADSYDGYCSYLDNVSVYDFLIDPSAGGYDIDKGKYCGRYGVKKDKWELKEGVKDGIYIKDEANKLINGSGNDATQTNQEDTNKQNKYAYIGSPGNRTIQNTNNFKLWEWYTTYEGKRYYLLLEESGGIAIKCELLSDLFKIDKKLKDAMFPFWSFAYMPNLTEFWTPSKLDYVREVFMAQGASVNQLLLNAEKINKPQRGVDITAIENLADLVYRRNGVIRFKGGIDINRAFQIIETAAISTPIDVYNTLETIQQLESGITAASKGVAEEDKVGIYEGNQAATADRYGVWNKTYAQGYKRFAKLYKNGIEDHLTSKVAVKILGPKGLEETIFVSKRDLKPQADWNIMVEATNAEATADAKDKMQRLEFLNSYRGDPIVNQKVLFEEGAEMIGFDGDKIRHFLDVSDFGDADLIAEAERDMEDLLNNKYIEPNERANTAYGKHIVDYMMDHKEDMDEDTWMMFEDYLQRIQQVIERNMGTQLINEQAKLGAMQGEGGMGASVDPRAPQVTEPQLSNNEAMPQQ